MKIIAFSVENFRSITEARKINLSSNTVIIGPNNEGKSNILRALDLAMSAIARTNKAGRLLNSSTTNTFRRTSVAGSELSDYEWTRDFPIVLQKKSGSKKTIIMLEFELNDDEKRDFKTQVGHVINGLLPLYISFSKNGEFSTKIKKQGPGSSAINSKNFEIMRFLARRINFQYIPSVRTAEQASDIVSKIISVEMRALENSDDYKDAVSKIKELQKPILDRFSIETTKTLKKFVKNIRSVKFTANDERRYFALRQSVEITVDDGNLTGLDAKGDGIQSLVALGLRRHAVEDTRAKTSYIFAIEEPEAHLHPDAIHELKIVLNDISKGDQVIITTHSGLLANREFIGSNIVVSKSRASTAQSLADIRKALGIRSYDNLVNAEVVLLVEGEDDKLSLTSILGQRSKLIYDAIRNGRLNIQSTSGAGSLSAQINLYKGMICKIHCFVDGDKAGEMALKKAKDSNLITEADYNLAKLTGRAESELEDLFNIYSYNEKIIEKFNVDLNIIRARNRAAKWSARIEDVFLQAGKQFDDEIKSSVKMAVAHAIAEKPDVAISDIALPIFKSLVSAIEHKLAEEYSLT
jgi:putative ATP-dependent endonuclease of OLD family